MNGLLPQHGFSARLLVGIISVFLWSLSPFQVPESHSRVPIKILVVYHSRTGHTEQMAHAVMKGAQSVEGSHVTIRRVGEVSAKELFATDALIVGSPVYWSNMSGEVKTFFDNWQFRFGVFPEFKMRNKVGAAFATGGQVSSGKELTMLTILAAMLGNQMIVVGGGGAFGASATTEGTSPGIDQDELDQARKLGKRVAEVTQLVKRGQMGISNPSPSEKFQDRLEQ